MNVRKTTKKTGKLIQYYSSAQRKLDGKGYLKFTESHGALESWLNR
jgi:hypothetical protein